MNKRNNIDIFIVEDNRVFTLALKAAIETTFAKVPVTTHSFETGEACMQRFTEEKPQIVLLDYHLNSKSPYAIDGIKMLDWIKRENAETKVIMLSGDDNIEIALKSFHHGASDYIVKTETKFNKVNYSLFNIFNLLEAKSEALKYKYLVSVLFICVALLVGGIITIEALRPSLFNK